ncbi:MAG: hypothetical protein ACYC6L_12745 [Anaerolineae bacterium]
MNGIASELVRFLMTLDLRTLLFAFFLMLGVLILAWVADLLR